MKNKKSIYSLILMLVSMFFLFGCAEGDISTSSTNRNTVNNTNNADTSETQNILNNAKEITIEESALSLGTEYQISVAGKQVAVVTGKFFNGFGDVFTLKDMNGNVIESEKQIKRWGTKITRGAQIMNKNEETIGYIGEEVISKLTSNGYFFHFYDKDKNEIGTSDQVVFSMFKKNIFKDNDGNEVYQVNENFSLGDSYTLSIKDNSKIPINSAIFMVCIEDAIKDSEKDDD